MNHNETSLFYVLEITKIPNVSELSLSYPFATYKEAQEAEGMFMAISGSIKTNIKQTGFCTKEEIVRQVDFVRRAVCL